MIVRVLGSAAGGGLPQWNCRCRNCEDARAGNGAVRPRSQSSIAVSATGERWLLVNVSPDVRTQLQGLVATANGRVRHSPVAAVLLTDAELDHSAGLLLLREGGRLTVHGTPFVREALASIGLLGTVSSYLHLEWVALTPGERIDVTDEARQSLGLTVESFAVDADPPLHWRGGTPVEGAVVGLRIHPAGAPERALVYVPGAADLSDDLRGRFGTEDVLLWDGTFWTSDELVRLGVSRRDARAMGHLPIAGDSGALDRFRDVRVARKVFVHINNTNPVLREDSPERRQVAQAGWEVAFDGMEIAV